MGNESSLGISVILPCLNEEASLGQVIESARRGIAKLGLPEDIIVVDNGSTDRSSQVAREHRARVLTQPHRGYGAALRKGFENVRYDIIVMGDADLSYDLSALDVLEGTGPIAGDHPQPLAVFVAEDHADSLGHDTRLARRTAIVNPMSASVH